MRSSGPSTYRVGTWEVMPAVGLPRNDANPRTSWHPDVRDVAEPDGQLALKQAHTKDEMREDLEAQVLTKSAGAPEGSLSIFGSD